GQPRVVSDAQHDDRVRDNLAVRDLGVVAYAGVPIFTEGVAIGAFCVIDGAPRTWTEDEVQVLGELAPAVEHILSLRRATLTVTRLHAQLFEQNMTYCRAIARL